MHSKLRLLLFADDLVLLSKSPEALQSSINSLSKYCLKWSQVNLTKTKVVCFSRQRTTMSHMFHLSGSPITVASEYKYLGVLLSANGSLKPAISILASQANKATFSLIKTSMHLGHPKPTTLYILYLFDTLVLLIVLTLQIQSGKCCALGGFLIELWSIVYNLSQKHR